MRGRRTLPSLDGTDPPATRRERPSGAPAHRRLYEKCLTQRAQRGSCRNVPAAPKIALAVLLAASIVRAFFGPPPPRPRGTLAPAAAAAGVLSYGLALGPAPAGRGTAARIRLIAGGGARCLAVWLARGGDDRDDFDEPIPEPDPPVDWAAFDRERARWRPRDRGRPPTPV